MPVTVRLHIFVLNQFKQVCQFLDVFLHFPKFLFRYPHQIYDAKFSYFQKILGGRTFPKESPFSVDHTENGGRVLAFSMSGVVG